MWKRTGLQYCPRKLLARSRKNEFSRSFLFATPLTRNPLRLSPPARGRPKPANWCGENPYPQDLPRVAVSRFNRPKNSTKLKPFVFPTLGPRSQTAVPRQKLTEENIQQRGLDPRMPRLGGSTKFLPSFRLLPVQPGGFRFPPAPANPPGGPGGPNCFYFAVKVVFGRVEAQNTCFQLLLREFPPPPFSRRSWGLEISGTGPSPPPPPLPVPPPWKN